MNNHTFEKFIFFLRQLAGVLFKDLFRYLSAINKDSDEWLMISNRNDRLISSPNIKGIQCDWRYTSMLHAPQIMPFLGKRLMQRAILDYPILLCEERKKTKHFPPDASIIIGHKGKERLPNLLLTLSSIAAQDDVSLECIVVEQSYHKEIESLLPPWVRYEYIKTIDNDVPYNRSLSFNIGSKVASGKLLILHDNDLLIPKGYVKAHYNLMNEGYDIINLKRYIFYLNQHHTAKIIKTGFLDLSIPPAWIMQNATGGGSITVRRSSYFAIGGFDEEFVGWGGEDDEFWERAKTLKIWPFAYLPLIHLWHKEQEGKLPGTRNVTRTRYLNLMNLPIEQRIKDLKERHYAS